MVKMKTKNLRPKILIVTDGNLDHPSSRIRALQYIPYLESEGFIVEWLPRIPAKSINSGFDRVVFALKKRIYLLRIFIAILSGDFKLLFIQRFFVPTWLLSYCKKKQKIIVFDFDDAIYISAIDKHAEEKTISVIRNADLVITSCTVLNQYSRKFNDNSIIITSAVDTNIITPANKINELFTIGWIGSEWTSKYLSVLEPVFKGLAKKYKFRLLLVGAKDSVNLSCETKRVKWSLEKENKYLNKMDIGIMPLFDNEFERAKGGYKLFQYMAAGKPVLASPVGINKDIVLNGENGYLCESENEWFLAFCNLMDDENLRKKMGNRGRELMLDKYGLDVCAVQLVKNLKKLNDEYRTN
ncbi:MAG: glycosyltransferase [Bacteroidetes bacterium]|nr:MAG: glycosyltransferase [Bacteroidota bacterium]